MRRRCCRLTVLVLLAGLLASAACAPAAPSLQKRWLFVWRDMNNPAEVDRMIARFPAAQAAGYNGVVFSHNIPEAKAPELREAARAHGLDLIAIVMGGSRDRNYMEGVLCKDQLFVVHDGLATLQQDNPTALANADFEDFTGNHLKGWRFQDDEGLTSFVDQQVCHGGKASLRMESIGKNQYRHCRVMQSVKLQPYRQYHISAWVRTEDLAPADAEIKVLSAEGGRQVSFQTFHVEPTQDWKRCDLVFNSLNTTAASFYLGSWSGRDGKLWWDDVAIDELGLVNCLRRPGCPVTVHGEDGTVYEEGRDFEAIRDPQLHPWRPYHEQPPIKLTAGSRLKEGDRLRVSYYHSLVVYEDRLTSCLSEPRIFADWKAEVERAERLLHPAGFLMSHDELRVINQCAACQSKQMTPGQLLAWNVHQAAEVIRAVRPDAEIWVWNDMFDPMHNAVDHYYAVNGSLQGSWEGLDPGIGIVNWYGSLQGKNCRFFADLGLKQILSGYYDGDESGARIEQWLAATKDVPGIVGAMYTTWEDKYGAMATWASKAW